MTFDTYPNCLFFLRSSVEKICTVPWSLATHRRLESWLKLMLKRTKKKLNFSQNIENIMLTVGLKSNGMCNLTC